MVYIDVSSALEKPWVTGIQRVVRSLACELAAKFPGSVKLISYDRDRKRYFALANPALIQSGTSALDTANRRYFDFDSFGVGEIFFEIDSTWDQALDRGDLFRRLKRRGLIIVVLNHDVIPILFPDLCAEQTILSFPMYLADHLQYADYALTTSETGKRDLRSLARRFLKRRMTTRVIKLGADFDTFQREDSEIGGAAELLTSFPELQGLRYLLSVGTIEPRKNHELLLDVFQRLNAADAALAIVGRKGWMSEDFLDAYQAHPEFGKRLFWYGAVDDSDLHKLYLHAHACVVTSYYEGFGLPAVEALRHGCATVCSDAGALPEVVANHGELFKSGDGNALFKILDRLYRDASYHQQLKSTASNFIFPTWAEAATYVGSIIGDIRSGQNHDFSAPLRQMVYLSKQPDVLDLSLQSVRSNLPFIDRVVILTQPQRKDAVEAIANRHFPKGAIIVADEEVADTELSPQGQAYEIQLRKSLYTQPYIEQNFLAADENAIALRPIESAHYLRQGVHSGYYFLGDMSAWLGQSPHSTDFDMRIRNTWRVLREAGYPARCFASHMPQIINKSLCSMIFDRFVDTESLNFDEWSLYFNVANHLLPRCFSLRPCETLGWPIHTAGWASDVPPAHEIFEYYGAQNYEEEGPFYGLAPLGDCDTKVARLRARAALTVGIFAVVVMPTSLTFIGPGKVLAGEQNMQCIFLINGAATPEASKGKLKMRVNDSIGATLQSETVTFPNTCWIRLLPPAHPGKYVLSFHVELEGGALLETSTPLTVV